MPTVKVTEPFDTFKDGIVPMHCETGDVLDGDLAVWALGVGLPVEIHEADPVKKAAKKAPAPEPDAD